jgi:hypothetical protein
LEEIQTNFFAKRQIHAMEFFIITMQFPRLAARGESRYFGKAAWADHHAPEWNI